jgi:hypothetical protein
MLTNAKRTEMLYSLLTYMLPEDVATQFEFSADQNQRIILAYTNQTPRPETKTVVYFSFKDEPYKQAISDPYHYTTNDVQVLEHMRQITLTIDAYSKVVPIGTANDVAHWLNSALISDMFEDWRHAKKYPIVIENIEPVIDLSYLLEGNVWNNRAQLVVKLNYRDTTKMEKVYMTRKPIDLPDTPNSVDAKTVLKQ